MSKRVFAPNSTGTCPHCGHAVQFMSAQQRAVTQNLRRSFDMPPALLVDGPDGAWFLNLAACPRTECEGLVISLASMVPGTTKLIWPSSRPAPKLDPCIPENVRSDFLEAYAVLPVSTKAAAALARRCLQSLLHDRGFSGKSLYDEIELARPTMSERLKQYVHDLRQIGNFSAHEKKQATGEVVDVDEAEAEWLLDLLDVAFNDYYVTPLRDQERRTALLKKLGRA